MASTDAANPDKPPFDGALRCQSVDVSATALISTLRRLEIGLLPSCLGADAVPQDVDCSAFLRHLYRVPSPLLVHSKVSRPKGCIIPPTELCQELCLSGRWHWHNNRVNLHAN
uniref:Uncharacterized protein n=1 Tax=Panagrellus redivivus TaxID=6233 RepID=A0A7E4ZW61_PANRE